MTSEAIFARTVHDTGVLVEAVSHVGGRVILRVLLPELGVVGDAVIVSNVGSRRSHSVRSWACQLEWTDEVVVGPSRSTHFDDDARLCDGKGKSIDERRW